MPFDTSEVLEIEFDAPLESSLFTFELRSGEQLRSADPITEMLSLEAAIVKMPFPVLTPTRVPDADHTPMQIMYHPPRLGCSDENLTLSFRNRQYCRSD